jgi:hypothetical protein
VGPASLSGSVASVRLRPPRIEEYLPLTLFSLPPLTEDCMPVALFLVPLQPSSGWSAPVFVEDHRVRENGAGQSQDMSSAWRPTTSRGALWRAVPAILDVLPSMWVV